CPPQAATMSAQTPLVPSQFWAAGQVSRNSQWPPEQMSAFFWAAPSHPSSPSSLHGPSRAGLAGAPPSAPPLPGRAGQNTGPSPPRSPSLAVPASLEQRHDGHGVAGRGRRGPADEVGRRGRHEPETQLPGVVEAPAAELAVVEDGARVRRAHREGDRRQARAEV